MYSPLFLITIHLVAAERTAEKLAICDFGFAKGRKPLLN
jgi:hypothetical protein